MPWCSQENEYKVEFTVVANGGKTVLLTIELDWTLYGPYAGQF